MEESLYRKKSLDKITSPESLNDYLPVTGPTVWLILSAVVLILAGMLVWSTVASIDSFAVGEAQVSGGEMIIYFQDDQIARNVHSGMKVVIGETESTISSVGQDEQGRTFAYSHTSLADGIYSARVVFRQTQVIRLLFN